MNENSAIVHCALVAVHSEKSADGPAGAIKRSSLCVEKRKKSSEDARSVCCSNKVCSEKKLSTQDQTIKRLTSRVDKARKERGKDMGVECSKQVCPDKEVTTQTVGRSTSCSVKKAKKRGKAMNIGCSSQTVESEQSAKKKRQEPVAADHHRKIPAPSSFRKVVKEKTSKTAARLHAKLRQRKLMKVELRRDAPSNVQPVLMKANQEPATANAISFGALIDANIPSPVPDQEPTEVHSVLGELVNAKRLLPVTPFTVQPAEESGDTDQASPSTTELVCLMEKFHITPSEELTYAAYESDSNSVDYCKYELYDSDGDCVLCDCDQLDDGDGEFDQFPELKGLPEQVFQIIHLLP